MGAVLARARGATSGPLLLLLLALQGVTHKTAAADNVTAATVAVAVAAVAAVAALAAALALAISVVLDSRPSWQGSGVFAVLGRQRSWLCVFEQLVDLLEREVGVLPEADEGLPCEGRALVISH